MSFLTLAGVEKTYPDGTRAVKGVNLAIAQGEFIVLLGPSGCGKTTTLRMVAGLELATAGRIHLAGADVTALRPSQRDVGFVFQFYALYPHLTVAQNLAFPLACVGMGKDERERRLAGVVERLGLRGLLTRYPRQLSGGDQQRVSLGRALVRTPAVWLMDEPLGTLDADQRLALRDFIREQQLDLQVTTIYVTHDQEEAMALADRIVVMEGGLIRQVATPAEIYARPASLFVASFVGSPGMNLLRGHLEPGGFRPEGIDVLLPAPAAAPQPATLGVRSEHVALDGPLPGTVVLDEYLGAWRNLHVQTACGRIVARAPADRPHRVGEAVRLGVDPAQCNLFGSDGARL